MTAPPQTLTVSLPEYLTRFASMARVTDAPAGRIGEAIAEIESHVTDSGEDPRETFGEPEAYARQLGGRRSPESLGAAILRLVALMYGTACLGTGVFTVISRLTASRRAEVSSGPAYPLDGLADAAFELVDATNAATWLPTVAMPALAVLLAVTALVSSRYAAPDTARQARWLLPAISLLFVVVLLWFIPNLLWNTLGYDGSPWKYQVTPGVIFIAAAAVATISRHVRHGRIIDPAGHDRTCLARDIRPAALTAATGTLALLAFPLLSLNWYF